MKHAEKRPYADPEAAARKLVVLATSVEPFQDGRIYIERINAPFMFELKGAAPSSARAQYAVERGGCGSTKAARM